MNARDIIKLAAQLYVYDALKERKHNESDTQNENHTT